MPYMQSAFNKTWFDARRAQATLATDNRWPAPWNNGVIGSVRPHATELFS
jgi:hypothetical protein